MSRIAVVDVETTGLNPYRHDRIIEIAVVVMEVDGTIVREFVSLVNPERDIGPTSIHGLSSGDLLPAPHFGDIAGIVIETLQDCVALAGHNVHFDHSFIACELERMAQPLPDVPTICTMRLAGGGQLAACCEAYGVPVEGPCHSALHDARAAAALLKVLLRDAPGETRTIRRLPGIIWPKIPRCIIRAITRHESRQLRDATPAYLQRLLARANDTFSPLTDEAGALAYLSLLDRVLEDRHIDEAEGAILLDVANRWGIDGTQVRRLHKEYLCNLAAAALADGIVTDAEKRDLSQVARLLGVEDLAGTLARAQQKLKEVSRIPASTPAPPDRSLFTGKRVCFTGECQCRYQQQAITREIATELANGAGILVVESVTKALDFLVVADPQSQSGKAKKARQYGIRILHEPVFWNALGLKVE